MGTSTEDGHLGPMKAAFAEAYEGRSPTHYSRAPGRVNLIGEHTDYNGLPVFPMALDREIRILFRPRDDPGVRVRNQDREFEPREFQLTEEIPPGPTGDWGNYLKAACQALVRRLGPLRGFDALVSSTLPVASGLSSSSALVIATGRALLAANDQTVPTREMAEEMARAERYTGTQGGGMDQAISLGARRGYATRIEFDPLSLHESAVPPGWHFVVAHTLVRAEKSGPAQEAYNRRTVECREALAIMGAAMDEDLRGDEADIEAGATQRTGGEGPGSAATPTTYPELMGRVRLTELLDLAESTLAGDTLKRFRHVVTEAARVYEAEAAMKRGDLLTFGILMDASHESLRMDYEVSSPELDRLVELARDAGAAGARLTGAGFGGCMVALVDAVRVDRVVTTLREGYYRERDLEEPVESVLFVAEASEGASVTAL